MGQLKGKWEVFCWTRKEILYYILKRKYIDIKNMLNNITG